MGSLFVGRLGRRGSARAAATLTAQQAAALRVLGHSTLRQPNSLPNPALPAGVDTMPGIEHIVVLMLENHSYDNLIGMLGREPARGADPHRRRVAVTGAEAHRRRREHRHRNRHGQRPRGDGFTIGRNGLPTAANPYSDGRIQHPFHMPTTCQLDGKPSQEWKQSHVQFDGGRKDGFVISDSGPVAMGTGTAATSRSPMTRRRHFRSPTAGSAAVSPRPIRTAAI